MRDAANKAANASPSSSAAGRGFPRPARLLRRHEFDAVYREGQRRSSKYFVAFLRPNGLGRSRFGSSVKRFLGGAVVRNRLRRRIREILRLHRLEIPYGWDMVIHPRRAEVATAEFGPLAAELVELLRSAASAPAPKNS